MQTQGGFRAIRIAAGALLAALACAAISTKLLLMFNTGTSRDTLLIINIVCFSLFILLAVASTIVGALSKVRFGLGKMVGVTWASAACVTCIVAAPSAEIISLGISGLVVIAAYLIAGVARANTGKNEE